MATEVQELHEDLRIVYSGPGVEAGTMDVRDLAPGLLALSTLFQKANREINPTAPDVALKVEATSRGSFHVDLLLHAPNLVDMLAGEGATALANLLAFVTAGTGLIAYLKLRHREPEAPVALLPNGDVEIVWADGTVITYPAAVMRLAASAEIKREVQNVVKPLESGEIDEVSIGKDRDGKSVSIKLADLPAFSVVQTEDDPLESPVFSMTLTVVAPAFDRKKWRVSDGGSSFWVSITDEAFQRRIESSEEAFAKGDYLRCMVRYDQYETDTGLRLEREVIEVLEHRKRPAPPPALFDN